MTGARPATTSEDSADVGAEDVTGEGDQYEHLSQTGEEFSVEFFRDRVGIGRVNVMPNVDHFQPRGCFTDFENGRHECGYYKDVRTPFNFEGPNTVCGTQGLAFYDSPIIRNPIRSPFCHDQRTNSGGSHGHEDALAALFNLTETSLSSKLKFLCSYGGRILPRPCDGRLRYVGGETRIISIRSNVSWDELVRKTSAIWSQPHTIKYQLPGEDLDALISVCSDEDLQNMIEEYLELERIGNSQKLRIFLVSLTECESSSSFEVKSEPQQDVDYQYVVAINRILDPSTQKNANVGDQVFHPGVSLPDHDSPGGQSQKDSSTYFQPLEARGYNPSSHLRLAPQVVTVPSDVHGDVLGSSHGKALCDNSYYFGGDEGDLSSAAKLHVLYNCSTEDGLANSDRSIRLLIPSSTDEDPSTGAYVSPSQEWYMKSQDAENDHSCNQKDVIRTNKSRTSGQGGIMLSPIYADVADRSRDNREAGAVSIVEINGRSYRVGLPRELGDGMAINVNPDVSHLINRVSPYRNSATSSAVKEGFWKINAAITLDRSDHKVESNAVNMDDSFLGERLDQGSITPLIVEDVTEKMLVDIPSSSNVILRIQDDPEQSNSNVSSPKEFDGSTTPDTDYEDVDCYDPDDEDLISDAAMAEIEAGVYGLQTIKNTDLEELRELGSGTFGTVYHGKWRGTDVAIKRIKKSCLAGRLSEQERIMKDFWREAKILSNLHHPNVVAFYGVVPDGPGGTLATVTEFMVNGSLRHNLLRNSRVLDRRRKVMIAMDAAFGMEYLHLKNIVHFDLKCDNLLVNLKDPRRPICKVGDFGLSRIKQNTLVSGGIRGTLPWMAPELLIDTNSRVSEKVDIYSFGIAMWEMLTGEEPYANMHCGAIIGGIVNNNLRPPIPERCDGEWRGLMEECWAAEPSRRPTFTEVALRLQEMLKTLQSKRHPSFDDDKPK
ncbi:hypothetical protein MLD38_036278 [Melastoma candidum]|uniref:Uncharacterized protein n=1 Tax=Melastoma candidum TaxID=119954 RepID=A0ACB9LL23_9MYRT|nr:hypothetical protein MLD38_036278 [Melastoma candidum]